MTAKAERRRAEILDVAFDLFAEQGYHATGIADIATRLRMSHGTFYRYFSNKLDILDHVIGDVAARIADAVTADNAPGEAATIDEYRAQVRRIVGALSAALDEDPRVARILLVEAVGVDPALDQRLISIHRAHTELTALYLQHGVEHGFVRADVDTQATARALVGMIFAAALDTAHGVSNDRGRYIDAAMRVMFDGIAA